MKQAADPGFSESVKRMRCDLIYDVG